VGAASLVESLSKALPPEVKLTTGPVFLSPPLDGGGSNGDTQVKVLGASDVSFRTHDVLISGPAPLVRRALALAQKFDRPRKQVRITIKIVTLSDNASSSLGVTWPSESTFTVTENASTGTGTGALVNGIRLGSFSHTPLVVSATLNALEAKGKAKTLSNPTLMLLDGERAFILSGQKIMLPVYKGKDQNGQSIYDTSETKVGIYLQVGVQVGLDNDMVLSLYPQVTSIQGFQTINGAEYPTINTSEEHTTVRASSGEVIVLGGMLKDAFTDNKSGLPFLSRLPLLDKLFSTDNSTKDKEELMIILTPELVDESLPKTNVKMTVTNPAPS
jgi:general secretion pathway protein D